MSPVLAKEKPPGDKTSQRFLVDLIIYIFLWFAPFFYWFFYTFYDFSRQIFLILGTEHSGWEPDLGRHMGLEFRSSARSWQRSSGQQSHSQTRGASSVHRCGACCTYHASFDEYRFIWSGIRLYIYIQSLFLHIPAQILEKGMAGRIWDSPRASGARNLDTRDDVLISS